MGRKNASGIVTDGTSNLGEKDMIGFSQCTGTQGATVYLAPYWSGAGQVSIDGAEMVIPKACVLSKFFIIADTAVGDDKEMRVIIQKNRSDTALNVGIDGATDTQGNDTVNEVHFAAGDKLSFKITITAAGEQPITSASVFVQF